MGRKRKTRWRRLSIGEISANEDEDGELGVTVISLTRSHSHSQNHSPVRRLTDRSLSGGITMTNNNKGSSSSPSLHASSTNLSSTPGGGSNSGGGSNLASSGPAGAKIFTSSGASSSSPGGNSSDKSQIPSHQNTSSPNPHSQSNNSSGYHNGHNHVPSSYNNSTHPPPNSVSSNESTSSSTGGGGGPQSGGHYNDRYHYTRENYRPPHHHHHHHHHHNHHGHHSNYNGSSAPSSHYQGSGEGGGGSCRGERGGSYHYSGHPHSHKEYQNGYHGPGHYSGYQGSSYYRNSHNNYRSSHYSGGGGASGGGAGGAEPYNGGESEGYHYPPSSRPYGGGRFRKSRTYPASNYYYPNGKSSGGASNNTSDNINRPSFNQDEYTKITTPRQDVLFKKGYLSQKKTQPSSSSVDSTSAATTPSASTNGTPDTQSTNGINSDNSEGYENGETDYVIPYDDTIYYAPPPPEAVFTDPNTGQVYYGHCSSTGEYYDAYPVSPVMVAAGYPPVYYPMMPYAPAIDWNGVPTAAPMYPYVAAPPPPPHQLPPTDDPSLVSSGLQGLESVPATTNPNTNSDTTTTSAAAALPAGADTVVTSPSTAVDPSSSYPEEDSLNDDSADNGKEMGADDDGEDGECDHNHTCSNNKEGSDSGLDSGSSVADDTGSAATSQGNSSGAEEECAGNKNGGANNPNNNVLVKEEPPVKGNVRSKKQHSKQGISPTNNNNKNSVTEHNSGKKVNCGADGGERNNNERGEGDNEEKVDSLGKDVEKLHLSTGKDEYSSSESVLSSASSTDSGKASPPTLKNEEVEVETEEEVKDNMVEAHSQSLATSSPPQYNHIVAGPPVKGITAMVINSQHPPHLTHATGIPYNAAPHQQGIPVAAGPVMTTLPLQVGCPPVMIAAPTGMPLPPLVPAAAPMHPIQHVPPPPPHQVNGPHHHHHTHHHHPQQHGPNHGHHHQTHHHHNQHHNIHHHPHHSHPPPPPHVGGPPPPPTHHSNYPHHHNHHHNPRHYGPHNNPPQNQNPPGQQQPQQHQPAHHVHLAQQQQAPPPPSQNTGVVAQAPLAPPAVAGPPPPGSTPYHVYPHPTAYVYGPPPAPVYNDEGSAVSKADPNIFPSTTANSSGNLETKSSSTATTTSATHTGGKQGTHLKGEMKTTTSTEENGDETQTTKTESKHNSPVEECDGDGESKQRNITCTTTTSENTEELEGCKAKEAKQTMKTARMTGSSERKDEEKGKESSCDLKLENVIVSKELLNSEKIGKGGKLEFQGKDELAQGLCMDPKTTTTLTSPYSAESSKSELVAAVAASAEASLTLETLNKKMNKEIENCSLKQDMSGAGEKDGKVGSFSSLPSFSSSPQPQQEKVAKFDAGKEGSDSFVEQAKVIIKSENGRENSTYSTTAFVLSSSSSSPSDPSSANESNTSSPVNDRTSLMRSQSKLASRKNVVNEEDDRGIGGESCNIEKKCNGSSSNCNSKKKKEKKNPSGLCHSNNNGSSCSTQINPNASNNNSNNNNNMEKRMEESFNKQFNLSDETDHHHKNNERGLAREQKKMMDNNNKKEEEDESRKGSGSSEDAANQESGQGSQNQMTSSTESGQIQQQQQETICSSSSFSTSASAVAASTTTEEGAIAAVQQEIEIESVNNMSSGYSKSNDRASLSSSKKPTDLTVQCPVSNGNEDVQFETLQLQQSPSLVHEPSSPDSLNTNQSVAGSEFAPGENLSMSESDFMNRTTSIDEIEEDLPQEVELPTVTTTTNEQGSESGASIVSQCPIAPSNPPAPSSKASPNEQVNEKISQNLEYKNDECVDFAQNVKTAENETLKEAIKSVPNASPKATSSSFSTPADSDNNSIQEGKKRDEGGTKGGGEGEQAPVRPQSITLAVTEWLKSQGDDALTPIIARASSSDEFEGDVEEETTTTEGSDEDDDDYEEGIQGSGKKRDDKASKLEQNQKNVYGNPWVAPSNKSGYSIVKVTRRRSRSSKNKNALENDGNSAGIGFPTSDGVCSRVAPLSSISSNNNSPPLTLTLRSASLVVNQQEKNERNGISPSHSNKYLTAQTSTCSTTSTSDDQDDCNYLTDNNYKMLNYKRNNNKHGLLHPTNSSCGSDPSSKNNSINTSSVGKQSKSHVPVHDNGRSSDDAKMELVKDYYDSGMELSSPENSTSSDSMKLNETTTFPTTAAARPSPKPVMNINQKSALSVNSTSKSFPVTTTESSKLESNDGRKWNCPSPSPLLYQMGEEHNKFINIDQVVIAAPLTIVETHSTKAYSQSCSHKKTGNINETERKESDSSLSSQSSTPPILQFSEPKSFSTSSPPLSSSKNYSELLRRTTMGSNNSSDTVFMVGGGDAQSLGSVPNSIPSIDERLHAEICNPQKYAKYYQFGVVFDTSDDPDQGIDTAVEDEIENENEIDSFQDIALETFPQPQPPSLPSSSSSVFKQPRKNMENKEGDKGEQKKDPLHHQKDQQKKSTTDVLMVQRNRKPARKAKKTDGSRVSVSAPTATGVIDHEKKRNKPGCSNSNEDVLVSKSVYLEDQDEEIGTFDPKDVLESRLRRASSIATGSHLLSSIRGDDDSDIERINNNEDSVALQDPLDYVTTSALPSSQQSHLYINPFSLAVELSGSNMGKVLPPSTSTHHNNNVHVKKKKADNLEQTRGDEQDSDDDSSSLNSTLDSDDYFEDDEPPLPPYESPPSVEIPVYNANTPAARVIRQNFYPIADPVSGAICCSIQ